MRKLLALLIVGSLFTLGCGPTKKTEHTGKETHKETTVSGDGGVKSTRITERETKTTTPPATTAAPRATSSSTRVGATEKDTKK